MFIFGMTAQQIEERRHGYNPWEIYHGDEEIRRALDLIRQDFFSLVEPGIFRPILESLLDGGDRYFVLADLRAYIEAQSRVDAAFKDRDQWDRMAILNVARSGKFSSDRTIREYAEQIWHVEPCQVMSLAGEQQAYAKSTLDHPKPA
jgi:starch phosphorylase